MQKIPAPKAGTRSSLAFFKVFKGIIFAVIIGIGLNLEQADFELDQYRACAVSDFVDQDWTLESKTEWLKALVASVIDAVDEVGDVGLKMTVQEWENVAAYQNEMIDFLKQ